MCTVCGCGTPARDHDHGRDHDHDHRHDHDHGHDHGPHHTHAQHRHGDGPAVIDFGASPAGVHLPGVSTARVVQVEQDLLGENDRLAAINRDRLAARGVLALNLVSSPGSGKTTLLVRTIEDLGKRFPIAVVEGDQQTSFDAERIHATRVPAVQINTGKGCHLDAHMVGHAIEDLDPRPGSILFIENVGNLVCPAAFDLGEAHKVVMLSVTEGEDKPLKYPDMFHAADVMMLTKVDLLPHVSFDVDRCVEFARRINPRLTVLATSTTSGEGLGAWYDWIGERQRMVAAPTTSPVVAARSGT